jgi:hypothetical protein
MTAMDKVQYDIHANTIGATIQNKVEAVNNPLLANLTRKQSQATFNSNVPRFNAKVRDEAQTYIGPGYYEKRSQFDNNASNQRSKTSLMV